MSRLERRSIARIVGLGLALAGLATIATAVVFVLQHRDVTPVGSGAAAAEFERLRGRFAGQRPLLDMDQRVGREFDALPHRAPLRAFHTVIFDRRGGDRLVKITVPYWFGRRFAHHDRQFAWLGELSFLDDTEFDPEAVSLSLDEIEQHGPGLLVDYRHPGGGQFIAWVE